MPVRPVKVFRSRRSLQSNRFTVWRRVEWVLLIPFRIGLGLSMLCAALTHLRWGTEFVLRSYGELAAELVRWLEMVRRM